MKVLVTGATGFIGSFLAEALLQRGYEVRSLVRSSSRLNWIEHLNMECYFGNLDNPTAIEKSLHDVDYVFHVAGITKALQENDFYEGNLRATKNRVDAIIHSGIKLKRFIQISSQAAAGPSNSLEPIDEQAQAYPINWYGKSKLAAERYLLQYRQILPITIIRPPTVYGPRDKDVLLFFRTLKKGVLPLIGGKERYLSIIYVRDLVDGIIMAAESEHTLDQTYFLAMERPVSMDEFGRIALNCLGRKGLRVTVPFALVKGVSFLSDALGKVLKFNPVLNNDRYLQMIPDYWLCSARKAKQEFGFTAQTNLQEGIAETIDWYVEHGWL
jgi:dihydroflavonol-4-reductase